MITKKRRRQFTADQKALILRQMLFERIPISDLADKYDVQPSVLYHWQKQAQENLAAALEPQSAGKRGTRRERALEAKIEALEAKLAKKDAVIAEISEEFVNLKKSAGNR